MKASNTSRRAARVLFLAAAAAMLPASIRADVHTVGVPVLSSRPGAAYTVYLDFAGFNYTGGWGGNGGAQPGVVPAYDGVTTGFGGGDQSLETQIWSRVAEKYSSFNVNVTTVDPAVTAGQAGTDAQRQLYYDETRMMHTLISASTFSPGGGGVSFIGVDQYTYGADPNVNSGAGAGYHTDWLFTQSLGGVGDVSAIGEAGGHENGHGFGLNHQSDYNGSTLVSEYSTNNGASGPGSFAPIMGASYYAQRGLWRSGTSDAGGLSQQNDVQTILGNSGMTLVDDGIGHSTSSATVMPVTGGNVVNFMQARGIIEPGSSSSPNPNGVANYTSDYYSFTSNGGSVTLNVTDGSERITPGAADGGATLSSSLSILGQNGSVLYTAANNPNTLSESLTETLPAGTYYAEVASSGGESGTFDGTTNYYYDIGSYFLTGSGIVSSNNTNYYWTGGASAAKWSQVDGSVSNWRTDHSGGTDRGAAPISNANIFFTVDSGATALTTTLGSSQTINSLNFTGNGTTASSTSVTIAADGSTLSISAAQGYINASGTGYEPGTGLVVQAGSAAQNIAVPIALLNSQTWEINNSASNPLTVTGPINGLNDALTITGGGKLILTAVNGFSGGTTIAGGTTVTFSNGSLGNGSITLQDNSTIQYANGNTQDITSSRTVTLSTGGAQIDTNGNSVVFSGAIVGPAAGPLTKLGAGSLVLNKTANPSNLFVRAGAVVLGSTSSVSTATTPVSSADNYTSIGQAAGDNGAMNLAGSAIFTGAGDVNVADVSSTGVLNLQGSSTVYARTLAVGKYGNANGTVNQSGGTVVEADNGAAAGDWRIGGYGGTGDSAAVGVYNLSGGSLNSGYANLQVGAYGTGTVKQTAGTATVGGYLAIGRFGGGAGTWDLSSGSGSLTANAQSNAIVGEQGTGTLKVGGASSVTVQSLQIGSTNGGNGTVTQTGGTITAPAGVVFGGSVVAGGTAAVGSYTLEIGSVLSTSSVTQQPGTTITGTFNFSGGTLRASSNGASLMNGVAVANVQTGGAIIDTNGNSVSLDQTLVHPTALGATPDGGLTKNGAGVLTVTAASTYTGGTTVNAGTLQLSATPTAPISGAVAWFDANNTSTLTTASGVVTNWNNLGAAGAALNAADTVAGVGPTVTTPAGFNGKSVLTFNNASSGLVTASNLGISGNQDRTLFVVGDRGAGSMFLAHEGGIGTNNLAYGVSSETGNSFLYTWGNDVTFGTQPVGADEIFDSELTNSGALLSGHLIDAGTLSISSVSSAANTTATPLYLGDRPTGTSTGDLAEVIEYNGALTGPERAEVEAYLDYKWFGIVKSVSNLLPTTTAVSLTASGATLALNGVAQTIGSLTGAAGTSITLGGATLTTGTAATTFAGGISGTGAFTVQGSSALTLSGSNSYTGLTAVGAGATLNVSAIGSLPIGGALTATGTVNFNAGSGGILTRTEGAITLNAGGKINLVNPAVHSSRTLLVATSLSLSGATNAWTSTVDLAGNDLDVQNGNLATITDEVKSAYAGAAWTGMGITSSTALADSTHLTTLGVILNGTTFTSGGLLFDGTVPDATDVLVKYTYFGDANLDGHVDGSDYTRIDFGFISHLTGWGNGDFNYDGVIDGSDYTLIDNAFNRQVTNLSQLAQSTAQIATSAVPEPAMAGVILVGGALARRRRRGPAFQATVKRVVPTASNVVVPCMNVMNG